MSDAEIQLHDNVVGDGHEMGGNNDMVGDEGDEDSRRSNHRNNEIVGEMGGVHIGQTIRICGSELLPSAGKVCTSMVLPLVGK